MMCATQELRKNATIRELYDPAMNITGPQEARAYFEALVHRNMKHWGQSREEAEGIIRQNLGYYAGYCDRETRLRVEELFGCAHPVFGKASEGTPTPEEALAAGREAVKGPCK